MVEIKNKQMEELLVEEPLCPICLCTLVKPILLTCGHWLCILCSTELVDSGPNDIAKCPLCRKDMEPNFPNKKVNTHLDEEIKKKYPDAYKERVDLVDKEMKKHEKGKKIIFEYGNTSRVLEEALWECFLYFELPNKDISTYVESVEFQFPFGRNQVLFLNKPPFKAKLSVYGIFNVRIIIRWKRWLERDATHVDHFISLKDKDNRQRLIIKYDADWK